MREKYTNNTAFKRSQTEESRENAAESSQQLRSWANDASTIQYCTRLTIQILYRQLYNVQERQQTILRQYARFLAFQRFLHVALRNWQTIQKRTFKISKIKRLTGNLFVVNASFKACDPSLVRANHSFAPSPDTNAKKHMATEWLVILKSWLSLEICKGVIMVFLNVFFINVNCQSHTAFIKILIKIVKQKKRNSYNSTEKPQKTAYIWAISALEKYNLRVEFEQWSEVRHQGHC